MLRSRRELVGGPISLDSSAWCRKMPLLKYFATVGTILLISLFAISYALGPADEPRRFTRTASIVSKNSSQYDPAGVRGNSQAQNIDRASGTKEPGMLSFPATFPVAAPTTNVASTLKPIQNEVLDEKVPLPTPRPLGSDDTQSLPVATAPLTIPKVKKAAKRAPQPSVRHDDVTRAYTALRVPSAPLPFAGFTSLDPSRARR